MNHLASGIIAEHTAYQQLACRQQASVLVFSDTHGATDAVQWIFSFLKADACLYAGDGVQDILTAVENLKAAQEYIPPVIALAQGNCDENSYTLGGECCYVPLYQHITIAHNKILITHGHLQYVDTTYTTLYDFARGNRSRIVVYGHTHAQSCKTVHTISSINGGSPLRPYNGAPYGGFAHLVLDAGTGQGVVNFYFLHRTGTSFSATLHSSCSIPIDCYREN